MQGTLEEAISAITGEDLRVIGAGRTDAGAHALRHVIAFSTASRLPAGTLQRAMNARLPADIVVTSAHETHPGFHPRRDAVSRVYRYLIWDGPVRSPFWLGRAARVRGTLDVQRMNQAASLLVGRHDFSAFVAAGVEGNRVRTMYRASCCRDRNLVAIELEANGFMRQMVRSIVGTLISLGRGKIDSAEFQRILDSQDRAQAGVTAPAEGLYLIDVRYAPYDPESETCAAAESVDVPEEPV